ncbi:MAG: glycoside hydrolase family 3, partial [Methanocorpusculaceae archaeon]|nr:glycoside hydrolase family 3 [Methanocorpusculaceae archaeon]
LRGELGYDGIVITDALNMSAITEYYTSEEAAVMAIEAGADMLLMPEDFETAYNAVLTAVQDGTISEERINESLRRIYRVKYADKLE